MARYGKDQFLRDLAIYSTGAAVGAKNTGKFLTYAGKKGIQLGGAFATRAAPPVARGTAAFARRNPVAAAALGGYGLYQTGVLDPVEEAIQAEVDRRLDPLRNIRELPETLPRAIESPVFKPAVKRKVSKYSRAIKMGMAAVKSSKFNGKKGKISNPKTTFAKVNKVTAAINKGKKVSAKGVTGVIKRAVSKYL